MAAADIESLANVRLWVLGNPADSSEDAFFDYIMPNVTGYFQDYTHRQLCQRVDFKEVHYGRNDPWLVPYDAPITSVLTLKIVNPDGDVTLDDLTEGKDFVIAPSKEYVILRFLEERRFVRGNFRRRFPAGENNVEIVYTSGFTDALMPKGIKMAYVEEVKKLFQGRTASVGFVSERIGKYSYQKETVAAGSSSSGQHLTKETRGALLKHIKHRIKFNGRELEPTTPVRRI